MPEAVYACGEVVGVSPKRSSVPCELLTHLGGVGIPWDGPDIACVLFWALPTRLSRLAEN